MEIRFKSTNQGYSNPFAEPTTGKTFPFTSQATSNTSFSHHSPRVELLLKLGQALPGSNQRDQFPGKLIKTCIVWACLGSTRGNINSKLAREVTPFCPRIESGNEAHHVSPEQNKKKNSEGCPEKAVRIATDGIAFSNPWSWKRKPVMNHEKKV